MFYRNRSVLRAESVYNVRFDTVAFLNGKSERETLRKNNTLIHSKQRWFLEAKNVLFPLTKYRTFIYYNNDDGIAEEKR